MISIPQSVLDGGWRAKVHVQGWNPKTAFLYVRTETDGTHVIRTEKKPVRTYRTKNRLCYTNAYKPSH